MSLKIETVLTCDGPCGTTYAAGDSKYQPGNKGDGGQKF